VDGSGAGLTYTSNTGWYVRIGNIVTVGCTFTLPANASSAVAVVGGLPFTVANQNYAQTGGVSTQTSYTGTYFMAFIPIKNTTTASFNQYSASGLQQPQNQNVSSTYNVQFSYPIS
jgi:hypothetical protein